MSNAQSSELLASGQDSTLELRRDEVRNHDLVKNLVVVLDPAGGTVPLEVEDDGAGLQCLEARVRRGWPSGREILGRSVT